LLIGASRTEAQKLLDALGGIIQMIDVDGRTIKGSWEMTVLVGMSKTETRELLDALGGIIQAIPGPVD
jgi:hypothetical protein